MPEVAFDAAADEARQRRRCARRRALWRARAALFIVVVAAAAGITVAMVVGGRDGGKPASEGWRSFLPRGSVRLVAGPDGGSIWQVAIRNSFVSTRRPCFVYLPPFRAGTRYPVVYLLHGFPGSPATFIRASRLATVADDLIEARKLRPLIVVMPVAGRTIRYDGEWAGPWEQFVVHDVLPWADSHLPTIAALNGRAIGGLSAGGFGAVNIALRHPKLFGTIESWAGYFHPLRDGPFAHATRAQLARNDPTLLVARHSQLLRQERIRVFLAAGKQDPIDIARARQFAALLDRLHITHVLVLKEGAHHESFWRRILPPGLAYTFPTRST